MLIVFISRVGGQVVGFAPNTLCEHTLSMYSPAKILKIIEDTVTTINVSESFLEKNILKILYQMIHKDP